MRLILSLLCILFASSSSSAQEFMSLAEVATKALNRSQLTTPGSEPFHLIANLKEKDSPDSDYQAKVEIFWVSPTKWRRIITSEKFSQVRVINDNKVFEQNTGDYFPVWLNNMITSIFDPVPMLGELQKSGADTPRMAEMTASSNEACSELHGRIDRWVFCFHADGLLSSVFSKGYAAEFKEYAKFAEKRVPRLIECDPEPGTHLETRITSLEELKSPDEKMFEVQVPTPLSEQIARVHVNDDFVRKAALATAEIEWPTVGDGLLTGGCAVYVSADRTGQIREAWPAGCDNAALQDPLRKTMLTWKLKPAISNGNPVQVESLMGFTFHTQLDSAKSLPLLTNEQARALAIHIVEPRFPPNSGPIGTEVVAQISVDQAGKYTGILNTHHLSDPVFLAIASAVTRWQFRPFIKEGKPQYFHADVTFHLD